jgi:transaldolase
MPEETIRAFQDHGRVEPTLEQGLDEARRVFDRVAEAGIDYEDVTDTLEREGVDRFAGSFADLLEGIRVSSGALAAA